MDKKALFHSIEWVITLAACVYLVWRLVNYDNYPALWETLRSMGPQQWLALVVCVALMPVNMLLEAWRWKTLIPMSWTDAQRQVYYSRLAGLVTPWRLGEYPARALLMNQRLTTNDYRPTTSNPRPTTNDERPTTIDHRPIPAYGLVSSRWALSAVPR